MSSEMIADPAAGARYYRRFTLGQRVLHAILMVTFLGLAATGLTLRFSNASYSLAFAHFAGGFPAILFFHKLCAVTLTIAFLAHVGDVLYRALVEKQRGLLWGPGSLVPNARDFQDFFRQMKWFLFRGPKPEFERFAYWEKVDYWAVFWGMAIIGISGYAMWFAPFFARFIPGSWLNVALLVHGEEALLAVSFIFVVHFFNGHLRPENFPMDTTIFTGTHTEQEFKERHGEEFKRLEARGALESLSAAPPTPGARKLALLAGSVAIGIGMLLLVLTVKAFVGQ
jgi:cytochrome b subunit of formate dehydrogenase